MQRTVRSDFARPIRLTPSGRPRQEPEGSVIKGQPATAESEETSPPVKASRGSIGQAGPPASTTQRSSDLAEQMCGCVCGGVGEGGGGRGATCGWQPWAGVLGLQPAAQLRPSDQPAQPR